MLRRLFPIRSLVEVQARIDAEGRAVVEEAITRPLGQSQDGICLSARLALFKA
jgi:hypothetical protein